MEKAKIFIVRKLLAILPAIKSFMGFPAASCRFHPSCSSYALQALDTWGLVRGSLLTVWRILRCNPFSAGGFDPVPKR